MEKIAIGVPYEISIEPSIDIGEFDAELILDRKGSRIGVDLKRIKGTDVDYTFIVPSELKDLFKKSSMNYSIFVYKENARFEVDDGKISFIDEKDFKVKGTSGSKMRRAKDETPEPTATKKPKKKTKRTPEATPATSEAIKEYISDPVEFAQSLIERQADEAHRDDVGDFTAVNIPEPTPLPETHVPPQKPSASPGNLHGILAGIKTKRARDQRRQQVNETIRKKLNKSEE